MNIYDVELHKLMDGSWDWKLLKLGNWTGHKGNSATKTDALNDAREAKHYDSKDQRHIIALD